MAYKINGTTVVDNSRNVCACCVTSCCITASTRMDAPSGNTASRPGSPATGSLYFDTDEGSLVSYNGTDWAAVGGASVTQTELVQMGNFLGPFVCKGNCSQGPTNVLFNACTCTVHTLECCNSALLSRSLRWCASGCCFCYLFPMPNPITPTPSAPQSQCVNAIGSGISEGEFFCMVPMKCGFTMFQNNTSWSEINGCYLTNSGNSVYTCTICGHSCQWYQGGLNGIYGKFFHNMSNPDFIIRFSGGIFCVCCHPTLCDGCLGCKGMFLSCHCAKCCGQCVGSDTPHKVLWELQNGCCVVFKPCCNSKAMCCHNFMAVANGYVAGMMEEGCSSCHVINHYFFVCPETAQVTRLFSCCHCHGYLWDHCNNRDFVKVGMNATLWYAHCCRNCCYAGCFVGTFITVSLKGTEECPCFDPTDYTIRCCKFQGCNISDVLKQYGVIQYKTTIPCNQNHPLGAYGKLHANNKPFIAQQADQEATDCSGGWLGRSGVELVTETIGQRINKTSAGSYRAGTIPNGETFPVFYTSYVPSDIETWGCLHCCNSHPSTPCPQNLIFICWAHGSGISMGYSNKWHAGVFCSCNCNCNLCKQLTYVALFCA